MNPTALPVAAPATSTPAQPAAAATEISAADFMLMLGQMVGAVPQASGAAQPASAAPAKEGEQDTTETDEVGVDLLGLFPFSVPVMPQNAQFFAAPAAQGTASLDIKSIVAQGSSAAEAQLLDDLVSGDQALAAETTTDFGSVQLSTINEAAQAGRQVTADATLARPVHQPVGTAAWADEIGSRLTLMAEQGKHTASLRLSPEHLGPLEIRISVRDDQASVWFGAAHAETRAAIETALPRLRELLGAQGLSLTDAGVFREPPRDHPQPMVRTNSAGGEGSQEPAAGVAVVRAVSVGLVDMYA